MSKFVVSANYHDRESKYRWLVRLEGAPIESAVACRQVRMLGVEFVASKEEAGFGCSVVALCEKVNASFFEGVRPEWLESDESIEIPDDALPVTFDKYQFVKLVPVSGANAVSLGFHGDMFMA